MSTKSSQHSLIFFMLISVFLFLLAGMLFAGLWPFNFLPKNRVYFDSRSHCLLFKNPSLAVIDSFPDKFSAGQGFTIEIKLKSIKNYSRGVPRILSITNNKEELLIAGQWKSGIIFRSEDSYLGGSHEIGYGKAFSTNSPVLVTFSTDKSGSVIYIDGKAVRRSEIPILHQFSTLKGIAVIANSAAGDQPWSGELYHISFFNRSLSPQEVRARALGTRTGPAGGEIINFNFSRNSPDLVYHNEGSLTGSRLNVPKRFSPPEKEILRPPWSDFSMDKAYFIDVILNLLGFIPAGVILGLIFRLKGINALKAILFSLLISATISSTIELLQVFLPTRSSQLSDLILNSLGGVAGTAAIYFLEKLFQELRSAGRTF